MKRSLVALLLCSTLPVAATPSAPAQYRVRFEKAAGFTVAADGVGARIVRASDTNAVLELTPEGAAALESNPAVASIEACPGACVTAIADAVELRTWSTGTYQYDGVGNIWAMGEDRYAYDYVSRLASATVKNVGPNVEQSFAYDAFGNIVTITTNGAAVSQPVNSGTNRRTDWTYDPRGNATVTVTGSAWAHAYDALNMQTGITKGGAPHRSFVYTADDERIGVIESTKATVWRLRGLDKKVLREYTETAPDASGKTIVQWSQDFLHRGGQLVASEKRNEFRYYHLDHLGSTRLVTNELGQEVSRYDYYPFGEDARPLAERGTGDPLQYTGHERDQLEPGVTGDARTYDYMHARYYSGGVGRFQSVDPVLDQELALTSPQGWNRYTYVRDNPINKTDPTGRCEDPDPNGKSKRICIQTFIPPKVFGVFKGDGRKANPNGGTYRTSQTMTLTPGGRGAAKQEFKPGVSAAGPLARTADVQYQAVKGTKEGVKVAMQSSDGLLPGASPSIFYGFTLKPGADGNTKVSGQHSPYPALEVWQYETGKQPQLIYSYAPPEDKVDQVLPATGSILAGVVSVDQE